MQRFLFYFEVCLLLFMFTGRHSAAGQERRGAASKASTADGRQVSKKESGAPAHRTDGVSASGRGAFVPLWRYAVKIAPSYGHGGLVCGDWNGDGSPQILVCTKAGMLVLDQNGKKQALVPLGDQSDLLALGRTPQGPLLIGFGVWGNIVEAYDRLGKRLWSYPAGEKAGVGAIDWAAVVDIGDPKGDAVAVGYNGDAGISLLDATGKFLWNVKGPANVWSVGAARLSKSGPQSVVGIGPDNSVVVYDLHGTLVRTLKPREAEVVFGADLDGDGVDEVMALGTTLSSGGYLWVFGADGTLRWRRKAEYGTAFAVGRFLSAGVQVVIGEGDGRVFLFGSDGALLPGLKVKPDVIELSTLRLKGSQDAVVALTSEGVVCYQWQPDRAASKPILPEQDKTDKDFPETSFVRAVQQNNLAQVQALLIKGSDPNEKNSQGSPVLIVAANRGYSDLVRLLLERGANINTRRKDGDTALMVAIAEEHSEIACQLIRKGAAIDTTFRSGGMEFPLLSLAVMVGQSDVVGALLKAGAHANAPDSLGNTPLFGAEKVEIARLLLDHGATLDARNWTGDTPLMNAVRDSRLAMVKFLIERGANVNAREDTARTRFGVEQMFGDKKTFDREKRLLQSGKLAVRHEDGTSILEWAEIMASHSSDKSVDNEIIALLKRAGAH